MFHFPTIQTSFGLWINENLFEAHLLTKCAYSECEPQGGEIASAELDGQYKRLRRVVAKLAHKAQWHGFQPICIANIPYAVRCLQRTSDCYEVNRVSVSPRGADAVGSLSRGNGGWGNT